MILQFLPRLALGSSDQLGKIIPLFANSSTYLELGPVEDVIAPPGLNIDKGKSIKIIQELKQDSDRTGFFIGKWSFSVSGNVFCFMVVVSDGMDLYRIGKYYGKDESDQGIRIWQGQHFSLKDLGISSKKYTFISKAGKQLHLISRTEDSIQGKTVLTVSSDLGGDSLVVIDISCKWTDPSVTPLKDPHNDVSCQFSNAASKPVARLKFISDATSRVLECEDSINILRFGDNPSNVYIARYCPMIQLSVAERSLFESRFEVYSLEKKNMKIAFNSTTITNSLSGLNESLQILSLSSHLGVVFLATPRGILQITEATLKTNLSGSSFIFSFPLTTFECKSIQGRNALCFGIGAEGYVGWVLKSNGTSGIRAQETGRTSETALSYLGSTGYYTILQETPKGTDEDKISIQVYRTEKATFVSRTELPLANESVLGIFLATREAGMLGMTDVGILLKVHKETNRYSVTLMLIRNSYLRVSASQLPKNSHCFLRLKNCSIAKLQYNAAAHAPMSTLTFYHLGQHFSNVLPLREDDVLTVPAYRNKLKLNLTELFTGIIIDVQVTTHKQGFGPEEGAEQDVFLDPVPKKAKHKLIALTDLPIHNKTHLIEISSSLLVVAVSSEFGSSIVYLYVLPAPLPSAPALLALQSLSHPLSPIVVDNTVVDILIEKDEVWLKLADNEVIRILNSNKLTTVSGMASSKTNWKWCTAAENRILAFAESWIQVWSSFPGAESSKISEIRLGESGLVINGFAPTEMLDARLEDKGRFYILMRNETSRVLGIFECRLPENAEATCATMGYILIASFDDIVILDAPNFIWILNPITTTVAIYDLNQLIYELEQYFGGHLKPLQTITISKLLNSNKLNILVSQSNLHPNQMKIASMGRFLLFVELNHPELVDAPLLEIAFDMHQTPFIKTVRKTPLQDTIPVGPIIEPDQTSASQFLLYSIDDTVLTLLLSPLDYTLSFTSPSFRQLCPSLYHTQEFSMLLSAPTNHIFLQPIVGVSLHLFNIRFNNPEQLLRGTNLNSVLEGFVQNFSLSCLPNQGLRADIRDPHPSKVERWGNVKGIACGSVYMELPNYAKKLYEVPFPSEPAPIITVPSQSEEHSTRPRLAYQRLLSENYCPTMNPTFQSRQLDFPPINDNDHHQLEDIIVPTKLPRPISDFFIYSKSVRPLLFTLHKRITVIGVGSFSSPLLTLELVSSEGLQYDLKQCFRLFEGSAVVNETEVKGMKLTLFCRKLDLSISLLSFSLNEILMDRLMNHQVIDSPTPLKLTAYEIYEVKPTLPDIVSKDATIHFDHGLLYVLDILKFSKSPDRHLTIYAIERGARDTFSTSVVLTSGEYPELFQTNLNKLKVQKSKFAVVGTKLGSAYAWAGHLKWTNSRIEFEHLAKFDLGRGKHTETPIDSFIVFEAPITWSFFIVYQEEIEEFVATDEFSKIDKQSVFKYSMICDITSKRTILKNGPFMLLQCINSTADDGVENDGILLYSDHAPKDDHAASSNVIYPVQEITLPNCDQVPNPVMILHSDSTGTRFIVAQTLSLFAQFSISSEVKVEFKHLKPFGFIPERPSRFVLHASNVISSASTEIVVAPRPKWIPNDWQIFIPVTIYLISLAIMLSFSHNNRGPKILDNQNKAKTQDFEEMYNRVMKGIISNKDRLADE